MKFRYTLVPSLPPLAWLLEIERGSGIADVRHGDWVETSEVGFIEGSWAGDFARMGFDDAFVTGTGAKLRGDSLVLVAPSHTLDRICVLKKGIATYASNSLPLVLAGSGEHLDDDFLFYDSYVASIRHGLKKYERSIPTRSKNAVHFYYCGNIFASGDAEFTVEPKKTSPKFANYQEYRAYLDDTIRAIVSNAGDRRRRARFTPMATLSRGYDSPTATVLAQCAGCERAVTFKQSRRGPAGEDSGTEIAEMLGLSVKEFGRLDYRDEGEFSEIRNSGGPSEFLSFGRYLQGTLLFTGFNGDMIWNKNANPVSGDMIRTDASGTSLTEYRIATGFVHLPVPFIGADSHASIYAISNSGEMAPWAVGGTYDRPIARRIVEEAGIPRQKFGQKKRAAGVVVTAEGLDQTMSEASLKDYNRFVLERWDVRKSLVMALSRGVKKAVLYNELLRRVGARVLRLVGIRGTGMPMVIPKRLRMLTFGYLGREALLFHWGVSKLIEQYRAALSTRT